MRKGINTLLLAALYFSASLSSSNLLANSPHEELRTEVEQYLERINSNAIEQGSRIEVSVGYIDPRLRLPGCEQDLELSLNGAQRPVGKLQVQVECNSSAPWRKFVPADVMVFQPIVVASHNLARGTILDSSHFAVAETDIGTLRRTPILNPELAIGKELKYSLTAGAAISQEILQSPKVVKRGDLVQLIAETESVLIRQQGEALQDGEVGRTINVRNSSSNLTVQATVVSAGRVKVQL